MKNILVVFICILFTPSLLFAQQKWEFKKEKSGIKVYTRGTESSNFKEFKGIGTMNTSLSSIVAVLRDPDSFVKWQESSKSAKNLEETDKMQIHYITTAAPWPVKNRDGAYKFIYTYYPNQKKVTVSIDGLPDYLPKKSNFVRLPHVKGMWTLTEVAKNKVDVVYQLDLDPGGAIPAWLANSMVTKIPINTMSRLEKVAKTARYQGKSFAFMKGY